MNCIVDDKRVVPVFSVKDLNEAKEYYINKLGFNLDCEFSSSNGFSNYIIVSYNYIVIHLSESSVDAINASMVFVEYSEVKGFYLALKNNFVDCFLSEFKFGDTDTICLEISDPSGNKLKFCEPVEIS